MPVMERANLGDILICHNQQEGREYREFEPRQKITPDKLYALRGKSVRVVWVTALAWSHPKMEEALTVLRQRILASGGNPNEAIRAAWEWHGESYTDLEDKHDPSEAAGGYVECSCGWPSREQYESHEPYIRHVIEEYEREVES